MLVGYLIITILIVSNFLFLTKMPVFNSYFSLAFSLLNYGSLILIAWHLYLQKSKKSLPIFTFNSLFSLMLIYMSVILAYTIASPIGISAFLGLVNYLYAPILFLIIYNTDLSNKTINRAIKFIYIFLLINILIGLLVYLLCFNEFKTFFRVEEYFKYNDIGILNLYRFKTEGGDPIPRLIGLSVTTTDTAVVCIFLILYTNLHIKSLAFRGIIYAFLLVTLYFTYARGPIVGLMGAFLLQKLTTMRKRPRRAIIAATVPFIATGIFIISSSIDTLVSILDPSSVVHLYDLLVRGPALVFDYWYGLGVGVAGLLATNVDTETLGVKSLHLESEYYVMILQIGLFGFIIFVLIMYNILKKLLTISMQSKQLMLRARSSKAFLFLLAVLLNGIFFPIMYSRLLSSLCWITIALTLKLYHNEQSVIESP